MKKILSLVMFILNLGVIFAQDNSKSFSGWKKTDTEHFTFVYEDAQKQAVEGYVQIADNAWNKIAKIYSMPQEKTRVYVTGRTNVVNAFTYNAPVELVMFTNPLNLIDFTFRSEWQELFFTHELIHAANFTFEDRSKTINKLIGPFARTLDFAGVDGWALEGLTTVLETELTDGGRGRSPFFELEYKSLTLDNGFIPYENVGLEKEPPYGQSYVIGYLIMKSIADRFGVEALADIERNRKWGQSWADAVQFVTGETPQDIYRDVRIALAKKYSDERKIPEGTIISPRNLNTCYYKPAIIFDDGTLITLRTAANREIAVVKLDPSAKTGSNYIQDQHLDKDLNTLFKETILFSSDFPDETSITADEKENIYYIGQMQRMDRAPGLELEMTLFKWNKEKGRKKLTNDASLFQPSVSRDGSLLVASEQKGMFLRLVKVDTETGEISPLLESEGKSFIYPAVNADGSKVACLETDGKRARVVVLNVNDKTLEYVANNDEKIFDPGYLSWNKDGTLTYACNYRGRLEVFEAVQEDGKWDYKPAVSDPVGVTWAYKNDFAIFYTSKASSGDVIKIKPVEEWGAVPDFEGPSAAGEKICFGDLESDYPDFKPYTVLSEVKIPVKTDEEKLEQVKNERQMEKDGIPIPVHEKEIKYRSEENKKKAQESNSAITEITDEKIFVPLPQPLFYFPFVSFMDNSFADSVALGFGAALGGITPRLQMSSGLVFAEFSYYPSLDNFDSLFAISFPLFNSEIDFTASRYLLFKDNQFQETNSVQLGFIKPIIHRYHHRNEIDISLLSSISFTNFRFNEKETSASSKTFTNKGGIFTHLGFNYFVNTERVKYSDISHNLSATGIGYFDNNLKKMFFGIESEAGLKVNIDAIGAKLSATGRYTPFPSDVTPEASCVKFGGKELDCSYAGYLVPRFDYYLINSITTGLDWTVYTEGMLKMTFPTFKIHETYSLGTEAGISQGLLKCNVGISTFYGAEKIFDTFNFYFVIKYGWLKI